MYKKIIAIVLAIASVTSILPAYAAGTDNSKDGFYCFTDNKWSDEDKSIYAEKGIEFEQYETGASYSWLDGCDAGILETDPECSKLTDGGLSSNSGSRVINSEWKKKGKGTALFDLKNTYWVSRIDAWSYSTSTSQVGEVKFRVGEDLNNMKDLPSAMSSKPTQEEAGGSYLSYAGIDFNAVKARYVEITYSTDADAAQKLIAAEAAVFGYLEKPAEDDTIFEEEILTEEKELFSQEEPEFNEHNTYIADLGSVYEVTKTELTQYNSRVNGLENYEVWLSSDGRNYMHIGEAEPTNTLVYGLDTINYEITAKMYARYVKFVTNKLSGRDGVMVSDIKIFGREEALQQRIDTEAEYTYYTQHPYQTADDIRVADRECKKLMDGDTQTTISTKEAWATVVVDLKDAYQIGDVNIYSLADSESFMEGCEIRYSLDGSKYFTYTYYVNHNEKNGGIVKNSFSGMPGRNARFLKIIMQSSKKNMAISEIEINGYPVEAARTKSLKRVPLRVEMKNYLLAYLDWSTYNNDNVSKYALYVEKTPFTDTSALTPDAVYERFDDAFIYKYTSRSYLEPETTYYFAITPFDDAGNELTKVTPVKVTTRGVFGNEVKDIFNIVDHPGRGGGGSKGWGSYLDGNIKEAVRLLDEMGASNKTRMWQLASQMKYYSDVGIAPLLSNIRTDSVNYGNYAYSNGNESDLQKADVNQFLETMKQTYKTLKSIDSRNVLVDPVLGGTEKGSLEWLDDLYEAGNSVETRENFEYLDVHLYTKYGDPTFPGLPTVAPEMLYKKIEELRAVMEKHGDGDKPIISTEVGYQTSDVNGYSGKRDYEEQRDYVVRLYMILIANDVKEAWYYCFQDYGYDEDYYEHHWGLIDYFGVPKPSYYGYYNMYQQMRNVELIGSTQGLQNPYYGYDFYDETKNGVISVVWAADGQNKTMSFETLSGEDENIEIIGCDGSFLSMDTVNGAASASIGRGPVYIYSKEGIKATSINVAFAADTVEKDTSRGNTVVFTLNRKELGQGLSGTVAGEKLPDGWSISGDVAFDAAYDKLNINVHVPESAKEQEEAFVLKVKLDNGVVVPINVKVNVQSSIEVKMLPEPVSFGDWDNWKIGVSLKNVSDTAVSADFGIISTEGINITTAETQHVKDIAPGESTKFYLDIEQPPKKYKAVGTFFIEVNGQRKMFDRNLNFSACVNDGITPEIDGIISPGEWDNCQVIENEPYTPTKTWTGNDDASFKIYRKWDDENFYMAVDVADDIQSQPFTGVTIWQGDCIQFALDPARKEGVGISTVDYFEMGLAMSDDKQELMTYVWYADLVIKKDRAISSYTGKVRRTEDNHTIYEIAIPWQYLGCTGIGENACIGFSAAYMDKDSGDKREDRLNYMQGINSTKDANMFEDMILIKK